jgi:hypothetical protein
MTTIASNSVASTTDASISDAAVLANDIEAINLTGNDSGTNTNYTFTFDLSGGTTLAPSEEAQP